MQNTATLFIAMTLVANLGGCAKPKCCCEKSQKSKKKASIEKKHAKKLKKLQNPKTAQATSKKKGEAPYNDPVKGAPFVYTPAPNGSNVVVFVPQKKDPVLKEMTEALKKNEKAAREASKKITAEYKKIATERKERARKLRADLGSTPHPTKLSSFAMAPHLPPVPQFYTGTCWAFAATSFFESEIMRLSKQRIKLSEMWTVYHNYLEKARRYIEKRGNSFVGEGDEPNTPVYIWKRYGVVPESAYSGLPAGKKRHDHRHLIKELTAYLTFVKEHELWDVDWNLKHVALILQKHLGTPPATFTYKGQTMTPISFLAKTGLKMDDYTSVISTARRPWYTWQKLDVPDNWRKSNAYFNVPLKEWYETLKKALKDGNTVVIGGDVSEPGKIPELDLLFIPTFDLPSALINQDARDFRIANRTTTDDHGVHLIGWHKTLTPSWFVFKDSGRSSRWGKYKGYYFVSGDYLRLKILSWFGHKSVMKALLKKKPR